MIRTIALLGTPPTMPPASPAPELSSLLSQGDTLRAFPSGVPVFPRTPLDVLLQEVGHCRAALAAEEAGCMGAVIDSIGDYGLETIRRSVSIPVAGAGEEGAKRAAQNERRFAIVTVWPASMNFIPERLLDRLALSEACIAIRNVGVEEDLERLTGDGGYLDEIRGGAAAVQDRILAACEDAYSDGAEAILLGCTCMSAIASRIAGAAALPVINPLAAGLSALLTNAVPQSEAEARDRSRETLIRMVDGLYDMPAEDCTVCATRWEES